MNAALLKTLTEKATVDGLNFNKELFAELIVKECVKLLDERDPDFNAYSKRVVKQHFGVNV